MDEVIPEETILPGWGEWSGPGVKTKKKKQKSPDPPKKESAPGPKHVIINPKREKKLAAKYLVTQPPFGFGNAEEYERITMTPIGKEWNSLQIHKKFVTPKVQTKLGAVIHPLKMAKSSRKTRL